MNRIVRGTRHSSCAPDAWPAFDAERVHLTGVRQLATLVRREEGEEFARPKSASRPNIRVSPDSSSTLENSLLKRSPWKAARHDPIDSHRRRVSTPRRSLAHRQSHSVSLVLDSRRCGWHKENREVIDRSEAYRR